MTGASIEATLELWASSLRDVKSRMRGLFTQERVAASADLFLDGLLSDERRKTGWMRAEAAGDPGPWRQQAILGRGQRLSAGEGTKGARLHDWAYCELADLDADEYDETKSGVWTRGLLIRRNISDGDLAYFTTWCPGGTNIQTLVAVEGRRWAIEDSFETTKNELGLDHNESRSWHGWHRHVSLVMLAFAMMAVIRYRANAVTPPKRSRTRTIRI